MLVSFSAQGKSGLRFPSGDIVLPAVYDATWRISSRLYGFRSGARYGIVSHTGRQVQACTLPGLYVGFREVTAATVLGWVSEQGPGHVPPLQWVLGRLCHADLLRAEEVTPQLWQADRLRHVAPSGEVVHITPAQHRAMLPGGPYAAEALAIGATVLVLTESTHLVWLTRQECADSALDLPLPDPCEVPPAPVSRARQQQQAFRHSLRALLTRRGIGHGLSRPDAELVDDYLPYEVACLPHNIVRFCRDHIARRLEEVDPQAEAKTWQLLLLAWLAANDHLCHCAETGAVSVSEQFVFDSGPFGHRTLDELLTGYELWRLMPWLRDARRLS